MSMVYSVSHQNAIGSLGAKPPDPQTSLDEVDTYKALHHFPICQTRLAHDKFLPSRSNFCVFHTRAK